MKRYLVGLLCLMPTVLLAQISNALKKAYFHQGTHTGIHTKGHQHIELGMLSFYFDQMPRIESSIVQKKGETMQLLFLPDVAVNAALEQTLTAIHNKAEDLPFTIQFAVKNDPSRKGLEITLTYPTDKVGVNYDYFNSIGLQKGVALRFYDRALINQINQLGKQIITTASLNPRVFIDCGHGGFDFGAVANMVKEKDISLGVGLLVANILKKNGLFVELSRIVDEFIPLDARTTLANNANADLFVSIHANSAANQTATGIETFFFESDFLKQGECFFSSLFEQKYARKQQVEKRLKSNKLAAQLHDALIKTVRSEYTVVDRSIKPAVFQVLLGTYMPSVLVEVGFVTHPYEAQCLAQKTYQKKVAQGIATGIMQYLERA